MGNFLKRLIRSEIGYGEILAFWDGKSKGTLGMMEIGKRLNIRTTYVLPNGKHEVFHEPIPKSDIIFTISSD
jgi:hypothetical protein